VLLRH